MKDCRTISIVMGICLGAFQKLQVIIWKYFHGGVLVSLNDWVMLGKLNKVMKLRDLGLDLSLSSTFIWSMVNACYLCF